MQIKLAPKGFPVAMTVDEARQHGPAPDVDHLRARGNRDLAAAPDRLEAIALDHDDRVVDRGTSGSVDQRSALDDQCLRPRRKAGRQGSRDQAGGRETGLDRADHMNAFHMNAFSFPGGADDCRIVGALQAREYHSAECQTGVTYPPGQQ